MDAQAFRTHIEDNARILAQRVEAWEDELKTALEHEVEQIKSRIRAAKEQLEHWKEILHPPAPPPPPPTS